VDHVVVAIAEADWVNDSSGFKTSDIKDGEFCPAGQLNRNKITRMDPLSHKVTADLPGCMIKLGIAVAAALAIYNSGFVRAAEHGHVPIIKQRCIPPIAALAVVLLSALYILGGNHTQLDLP
jgi:hypothetical protein